MLDNHEDIKNLAVCSRAEFIIELTVHIYAFKHNN